MTGQSIPTNTMNRNYEQEQVLDGRTEQTEKANPYICIDI